MTDDQYNKLIYEMVEFARTHEPPHTDKEADVALEQLYSFWKSLPDRSDIKRILSIAMAGFMKAASEASHLRNRIAKLGPLGRIILGAGEIQAVELPSDEGVPTVVKRGKETWN